VINVQGPGFFDLQVNGFAGVDFNQPGQSCERIDHALDVMRQTGVTRCLPTLITSSRGHFARCAKPLISGRNGVAGLHMEGPYINPEDGPRGAHARADVCLPSWDDFQQRQEAAEGSIRLVTLAPEMPGALSFIEKVTQSGVRAAIGHSAADPQAIRDAVAAGAVLSTHLGNGSHRVVAKHGNLLTEQLANDALVASFIVDGHHLPPASVKTMMRAKEPARCLLVTDAVAPAGGPAGPYTLGGLKVALGDDGLVRQPGQSRPSGSALLMPNAVALTHVLTGYPLDVVWRMAAQQPAALLGEAPVGHVQAKWDDKRQQLTISSVAL